MSTVKKGDTEDTQTRHEQEKKVSATTTAKSTHDTPTTAHPSIPTSSEHEGGHRVGSQTEPTPEPSSSEARARQVIAVSASKNPAAFFNLARRFLVTDEYCDLSALEGAIVSAVDAAHLLERSKLANIVRIQTSYVTVEPRKKTTGYVSDVAPTSAIDPHTLHIPPSAQLHPPVHYPPDVPHGEKKPHQGKKGNPLRRSRIIITVKRTEDYKAWLEENDVEGAENAPTPPPLT